MPSYWNEGLEIKCCPPAEDASDLGRTYDQHLHEYPLNHPLQQNHLFWAQKPGEEAHEPWDQ